MYFYILCFILNWKLTEHWWKGSQQKVQNQSHWELVWTFHTRPCSETWNKNQNITTNYSILYITVYSNKNCILTRVLNKHCSSTTEMYTRKEYTPFDVSKLNYFPFFQIVNEHNHEENAIFIILEILLNWSNSITQKIANLKFSGQSYIHIWLASWQSNITCRSNRLSAPFIFYLQNWEGADCMTSVETWCNCIIHTVWNYITWYCNLQKWVNKTQGYRTPYTFDLYKANTTINIHSLTDISIQRELQGTCLL